MNNVIYLATSLRDLWSNGCAPLDQTGDENGFFIALCNLLTNGISWLLVLAGVAAVLMIIWGGYVMITAGGDAARIEQGKKTILWAIVGIALIVLARAIIWLVIRLVNPSVPMP